MDLLSDTRAYWIVSVCWHQPQLFGGRPLSFGDACKRLRAVASRQATKPVGKAAKKLLDEIVHKSQDLRGIQ